MGFLSNRRRPIMGFSQATEAAVSQYLAPYGFELVHYCEMTYIAVSTWCLITIDYERQGLGAEIKALSRDVQYAELPAECLISTLGPREYEVPYPLPDSKVGDEVTTLIRLLAETAGPVLRGDFGVWAEAEDYFRRKQQGRFPAALREKVGAMPVPTREEYVGEVRSKALLCYCNGYFDAVLALHFVLETLGEEPTPELCLMSESAKANLTSRNRPVPEFGT